MYLKRYSAPEQWKIQKKAYTWVSRASPGPHPLKMSIPLQILVRDVLKFTDTSKEAQKIIKSGKILVDKKERKDPRYPVGLMNLIDIPSLKKTYRVFPDKKSLFVNEVKEDSTKLCRINGKRTLKKGLFQLILHDGRNLLTNENLYKLGDSLLINLPDQKILKHFQLKTGESAFVISGKNIGFHGVIKDIKERKYMRESSKVVLEKEKTKIETLKDYVLVGDLEGVEKIEKKKKNE